MTEHYLETQNGKIYYWTDSTNSPQTNKSTIVFLHGLSSNHTTWDETLALYKSAGFNILTIDLRGHGVSDKTRKRNLYKIGVLKNDVVEIIKKEGLEKAIIVGYSYGGYIGIDLAINNPDLIEKLVLISTNHASQFLYHWLGPLNPVIRFITNLFGWFMVWQTRKKYYYFNPKTNAGYWRSTFSGLATMPISINYWMLSEVFKMDYRATIYKINCPTLIVVGADDNFISDKEVNDMRTNIKNSETVRIGEGHYVATHYQQNTAEAVIKFLINSSINSL